MKQKVRRGICAAINKKEIRNSNLKRVISSLVTHPATMIAEATEEAYKLQF